MQQNCWRITFSGQRKLINLFSFFNSIFFFSISLERHRIVAALFMYINMNAYIYVYL